MFVELNRVVEGRKIKINTALVCAVFQGREEGVTLVCISDGRRFKVSDDYETVCSKLDCQAESGT